MTPQEAFVTRLRRQRQRNRISLEEIAAETRVKKELLEALEANDLSAWPRGLYARAWVRTYACAVGLDPIDTVDEFCRLFPHGDRRGGATMQDIASIVASGGFKEDFPERCRRCHRPARAPAHAVVAGGRGRRGETGRRPDVGPRPAGECPRGSEAHDVGLALQSRPDLQIRRTSL